MPLGSGQVVIAFDAPFQCQLPSSHMVANLSSDQYKEPFALFDRYIILSNELLTNTDAEKDPFQNPALETYFAPLAKIPLKPKSPSLNEASPRMNVRLSQVLR